MAIISSLFFNTINSATLLGIFVTTSLFWLPGVLLHLSYYIKEKDRQLQITKSGIELSSNSDLTVLKFQDISKIEKITTHSGRAPWSNYGFLKITTTSGSKIKITCLLVNTFDFSLLLSRNCNCKIEESDYAIPYLFV